MKKIFFLCTVLVCLALASCGGGKYDQKVVDELGNKKELTNEDYKTLIKQVNYGLDDAEKAQNVEQWADANEQEASSIIGMTIALGMASQLDPKFPGDLKEDVQKLTERCDKVLHNVIEKAMQEALGAQPTSPSDSTATVIETETEVVEAAPAANK